MLIKSDLGRFGGANPFFLYCWSESFKTTFWFRIGSYMWRRKYLLPIYILVRLIYKNVQHKTGIQLPIGTIIGGGLRFFHHDSIVVAQNSIIGMNVSIHQGVTIGRSFNGKKAGVPTIGNNVVIFAGAKILGKVTIGNNAVIGANAVVVKDVPDNAVVGGIPAKILSEDGDKCFDEHWGQVYAHSYESHHITFD